MSDPVNYYQAYKRRGDPDWYWKIWHYGGDGEREVVTARSKVGFATPNGAMDAASEYCDDHDIFAEADFSTE